MKRPFFCLMVILMMLMCFNVAFGARQKVVVLVRTGEESNMVRNISDGFTQKTGTRVEIREIGRPAFASTVMTQLLSRIPDLEVLLIQSQYVAQFAEAGMIVPLDQFLDDYRVRREFDIDDVLTIQRYKGKIYDLPLEVSVQCMLYRDDLITKVPKTWDEVETVARKFSKSINPNSPTTYGLVYQGSVSDEGPFYLYSVVNCFGGALMDDNGRVTIDSPEAIAAAAFLKKLADQRITPPEMLVTGFQEAYDLMEKGLVPLSAPFWPIAYSIGLKYGTDIWETSVKTAPLPGKRQPDGSIRSIPNFHGWVFVINSASRQIPMAWEYLQYAAGKEGHRISATTTAGFPPRKSILGDPALQAKRPGFDITYEALLTARPNPMVPQWPTIIEIMNTAYESFMTGKKTPEMALKDAAVALRSLLGQ